MKTVKLQRYSEPDVLREISPRMVVALLDEHRAFLASKGVELPAAMSPLTNGELDYQALATVFTSVEDFPKDLLERFHMVRQMDRILEAVRNRQLQLATPAQASLGGC